MPFWPPKSPFAYLLLEELRVALAPEIVDDVLKDALASGAIDSAEPAVMLRFADTRLRAALRHRLRPGTADAIADRIRDALVPLAAQTDPRDQSTARPAGPARGDRVRVAVMQDDHKARETLAAGLTLLGFEPLVFASIAGLAPMLGSDEVQAIVVPAELSASDARGLSDWLEASSAPCPVIVWPAAHDARQSARWGAAIAGASVLTRPDLGLLAETIIRLQVVRGRRSSPIQ